MVSPPANRPEIANMFGDGGILGGIGDMVMAEGESVSVEHRVVPGDGETTCTRDCTVRYSTVLCCTDTA